MSKTFFNGFAHNELALDPYSANPEISEGIQQSISMLQAWNNSRQEFDFVRLDNVGRLLVSFTAPVATFVTQSALHVTDAEAQALAPNANRRLFSIQNIGTLPVFISYQMGLAIGVKMQLGSGAMWTDELWTGLVSLVCTITNSSDVVIWEY